MKFFRLGFLAALLIGSGSASVSAEPIDHKTVVLQGLDKVTARISTIRGGVGQTVRFGSLEITVRRCQKSPQEELPESAAFLEIRDLDAKTKTKKLVFSGWMFASSPALSALEHPVYDVWVKDCK